jgi:hypothetical protein
MMAPATGRLGMSGMLTIDVTEEDAAANYQTSVAAISLEQKSADKQIAPGPGAVKERQLPLYQ